MAQWLGVFTFTDKGSGSFPGREMKILKAFRIFISRPGNEPEPLSVKVKTPNHWAIRQFPPSSF